MKINVIEYWNKKKEKLRLRYPTLTDKDLRFREGKEKEMIEMLGKYLNSQPTSLVEKVDKLCEETEKLTGLCRQPQQPDQPKINEPAKTSTPEQQS